MTDSVELLLDPSSDRFLREDWEALEAEGLPNQSRHQSSSNAPHITLAAATRIDDRYDERLAAVVDGQVPLVTAGFLVFPTRRSFVLARQIVAGDALTDLHRRVWGALDGVEGAVPTTASGAWTPHVTVAHGLSAEQLAAALGVLRNRPSEQLVAGIVRRWDAQEKRLVLLGGGGVRRPSGSGDLGAQ
ncbi:2'-5' RNA ligase family protein [Vibrio cholerae]|nr:2'-5' RNA ligase family protein [Vibrio cholerae]